MVQDVEKPRPECISVQKAACLLDVHEDTILSLIRRRSLRAFKVGQRWRIHRSDLIEYRRLNQQAR